MFYVDNCPLCLRLWMHLGYLFLQFMWFGYVLFSDKPLKKRKPDPHPQDPGAVENHPGPQMAPQEAGLADHCTPLQHSHSDAQRWQEQSQQGPGVSSSSRLRRSGSQRNIPEGDRNRKEDQEGQQKDVSKGSAPVVVLQKLSHEEVQKLMKEKHKSSKGSHKPLQHSERSSRGMSVNYDDTHKH